MQAVSSIDPGVREKAVAGDGGPAAALAGLRPPAEVMRLERLGSLFPSRLSFMPTLVRRLRDERWTIAVAERALDGNGYGHVVVTARGPRNVYSLVAFSHHLAPEHRSDRVIAEAWDATFVLYDGVPDAAEIARLSDAAPRQEAARYRASDLVLSRANKSVRFFEHVTARLAAGVQPDPALVREVGYLMRTTAVYGNGKFGIADRARLEAGGDLTGPFEAEMLTVYLVRLFSFELADHVARARAPETATRLADDVRRRLGIGNSTGLGMAPFLVNHPILVNNWMLARETALARVRAVERPEAGRVERFRDHLDAARAHVAEWTTGDRRQAARIAGLGDDLARLARWIDSVDMMAAPRPFDHLLSFAGATLGVEAQECLASLAIEPFGDLVDDLAATMGAPPEGARIDPAMRIAALGAALARDYDWALSIDATDPAQDALFWYVSEEKQEPRLGDRREEAGAERALPFDIPFQAQALAATLADWPGTATVAELVVARPDLRNIVRRVQTTARHPYAEIRDNLVAETCLPVDLLRCKLSFFGACRFDPKSDRWTRITLFAGAPLPADLACGARADWHVIAPLGTA